MAKSKKNAVPTPVEHYEMQKEFTRPTLMTGEYPLTFAFSAA